MFLNDFSIHFFEDQINAGKKKKKKKKREIHMEKKICDNLRNIG